MVRYMRKSRLHLALLGTVLFLMLAMVFALPLATHADNGSKSGRLITIHDRGAEKVILTKAATIGDALKEAGISLDTQDAVEPAASEKLVASDYQVNIYRARPIIIVDGNVREKIITAYQTPEQIVSSVGIKLYPEDKASIDRIDDLTQGAGLQLTITRATAFEFTLYGKTTTVRTQAKTVAEMLSEKGLKITKDDRVEPSASTKITDGLTVKLWREGKQTITVDEAVAFPVQQIKDADREVGYVNVQTGGISGSRNVTYEITVKDGQEVGRVEIASITTKQATTQVEVVGAKGEYTTPGENETIAWNFLTSNGFSRYQTAGIMGNLMQEHGFNTSDAGGGYGIVQWTGGRRTALMSMSYPENIYTQLNFLMSELNGGYAGVRDAIRATGTVDDAVYVFQNRFERCGLCMSGQRIQFAYNILVSH